MRGPRSPSLPSDQERRRSVPTVGPRVAQRAALGALGALALAAPAERPELWPLGAIAAAPWFAALRGLGFGPALALGAAVGALYAALLSAWLPATLRGLGASDAGAYAFWCVACAVCGATRFALWSAVATGLATRTPGERALGIAAAVYALEAALLRGFAGPPLGLLGSGQIGALGVAQLALVGGVPAISALLVAQGSALADLQARRAGAGRVVAETVAAWLALATAGLPLAEALRPSRPNAKPVEVLLLQPSLPRGERWFPRQQARQLRRVRHFVERALVANPGIDALLLPENLLTSPLDRTPALRDALRSAVDATDVPWLGGFAMAAGDDPSRYRSALLWIAPGRGIVARADKRRGVPWIESPPPRATRLASILGAAARGPRLVTTERASPLGGPFPLTALLCYEALFPKLAAARRVPGSLALAVLAEESWLAGSASRRLANAARFRAIETRQALLRVSHGGLSLAGDAFGRVLAELPRGREAQRRVRLAPSPRAHVRERAGIAGLAFAGAASAGAAFAIRSRVLRRGRR